MNFVNSIVAPSKSFSGLYMTNLCASIAVPLLRCFPAGTSETISRKHTHTHTHTMPVPFGHLSSAKMCCLTHQSWNYKGKSVFQKSQLHGIDQKKKEEKSENISKVFNDVLTLGLPSQLICSLLSFGSKTKEFARSRIYNFRAWVFT